MAYDPVPDLAALVNRVQDCARAGGSPAILGEILTGPYARLRGGLLLDEPGRENVTTEQAIRTALIQAQAGYRGPFPPESGMDEQMARDNGIIG